MQILTKLAVSLGNGTLHDKIFQQWESENQIKICSGLRGKASERLQDAMESLKVLAEHAFRTTPVCLELHSLLLFLPHLR